ncbi:MAG: PEGA domain-containing protein [Terriglobia bacterium]
MYRKFFGLTDYPFNDNPDPRFFCSTPEVDEAFTSLMHGVQERKGLILLTGEVGTGKTTLLKTLLERLDKNLYPSAFVFNTRLSTIQLLDFMMSDFGIEHDMADKGHMLMILKHWLLERAEKGLTAILVIDEAQNLPVPVLEEVRLLNNLETPAQKLLQIVLSGQPELEEKLKRPELRQLRYRLAHWCRTRALDLPETNAYVGFRLRVAGGDIEDIFTSDAVAHVYRFTRGIPRLINLLCTHSMISAYADQEKPVSGETVQALARHFELDLNALLFRPLPAPPPPRVGLAAPSSQAGEPSGVHPVLEPEPSTVIPRASALESAEASLPVSSGPVLPPHQPLPDGAGETSRPSGLAPPTLPAVPLIEGEKTDSVSPELAPNDAETSAAAWSEATGILPPQLPSASPPVRNGLSLNIIHPPKKRSARLMTPVAWVVLLLLTSGIVLSAFYRAHEKRISRKIAEASAHAVTPPNGTSSGGPGIQPAPAPPTEAPTAQPPPTSAPPRLSPEIPRVTNTPGEHPEPPRVAPTKARPNPPPASALSQPNRRVAEVSVPARPPSPPAPRQLAAPAVGQLEVTSNVTGAQVTIDGQSLLGWVAPHKFTDLTPGHHTVYASKPGYRSFQQGVEVKAGRPLTVAATLSVPSSEVSLLTSPPGAEVAIDGKRYGSSPVRTTLPPGEHTYSVSHAGFEPLTGSLTLNDQDNVTKNVELHPVAPKAPGPNVQLATTPPGSAVYVDGAPISGVTPATFRLSPGAHTVIFFLAGYRPVRREVNAPAEGSIAISETLSPQ